MASTVRARKVSASTVANLGSDNADANIKGKNGLQEDPPIKGSKTIVQRTREALGDIGNRLSKKNIVTTGKVGNTMKSVTKLKAAVGTSKGTENFVVPTTRPQRACNKQENPKKQVTKSNSSLVTLATAGLGSNKTTINPEIKAKVFTNLQRSHSTVVKSNVDGALKPINKTVSEIKIPAKTTRKGSESNDTEKENNAVTSKIKADNIKESSEVVVEPIVISSAKEIVEESITLFEKQVEATETTVSESNSTTETEAKENAYSSQRYEVLDIDALDEKNPLLVKEYILDICEYLFSLEKKYPVRIRYLEGRLINSRMRAVLLDWLVEVHHQFGFMPETLYIAAKTMDRYIQKDRRVTRKQLQLVGVTSMYIAAKFEEVCTPTVLDFSAVSDNAFTAAEVRHMEREILHALDFDLAAPPAVFFLRRFSKAAGVSSGMVQDSQAPMMVHAMAKYIMELTVVDYSTCHLFPSEQAASGLALAMLIMDKNKSLRELWTPTLEHYTKITFNGLKRILTPVASVLAKVHEEPPKLKAVHSKYARNRLSRVSLSPELHVDEWKNRVLKDLC